MLEDFIGDLQVESSGSFEFDAQAAIKKLKEGLDTDRDYFITRLCSGFIGLGGEEIHIRTSSAGLLIALKNPARAFTPDDLIAGALGAWEQPLRPLALALLAAQGVEPRSLMWLDWGGCHLSLRGRPEKLKNPWPNSPAVGVWVGFKSKPWTIPLKVSQSALYFSPIPIRCNHRDWGEFGSQSPFRSGFLVYAHFAESSPDGVFGVRDLGLAEVELGPRAFPRATGWNVNMGSPNTVILRVLDGQPDPGPVRRATLVLGTGFLWPAGLVPIQRGLQFDYERPLDLPRNTTIYAPADNLPTDLTHTRLINNDLLRQWAERQSQRARQVVDALLTRREEIEDRLADVKSLLPLANYARNGSLMSSWSAPRRQSMHQVAWQAFSDEWEGTERPSPFHLLAALNSLGRPVHYVFHNSPSSHGSRNYAFFHLPQAALPENWGQEASPGNGSYDLRQALEGGLSRQLLAARLTTWKKGRPAHSQVWGLNSQFLKDFRISSKDGVTVELVMYDDESLLYALQSACYSSYHRPYQGWLNTPSMLPALTRALSSLFARLVPNYRIKVDQRRLLLLAWIDPKSSLRIHPSPAQPCWAHGDSGWRRHDSGSLGVRLAATSHYDPAQTGISATLTRFNVGVLTLERAGPYPLEVLVDASGWNLPGDLEPGLAAALEQLTPAMMEALCSRDEETLNQLLAG